MNNISLKTILAVAFSVAVIALTGITITSLAYNVGRSSHKAESDSHRQDFCQLYSDYETLYNALSFQCQNTQGCSGGKAEQIYKGWQKEYNRTCH